MNIHWNNLIKRIEAEVNRVLRGSNNDGVAILTFTVVVDSHYKPRIWLMRSCDKVEPASKSAEFIEWAKNGEGELLKRL